MTNRIEKMLNGLLSRNYRKLRAQMPPVDTENCWNYELQIYTFKKFADNEKPVIFDEDTLGFNRYTDSKTPLRSGNLTPNYGRIISKGFESVISDIKESMKNTDDSKKLEFGNTMISLIEICMEIAEKYRDYAKKVGNEKLYNVLLKIPRKGAEDYYEAVVFLKLCIYCLRLYGVFHLTLGRFDQYMYPFYLSSKSNGATDGELLEITEEFFISINYDTDLYAGVQQGDNGQSMVLGGFDKFGNSMFNELSRFCIKASLELSVIDPKINLRVGKNTPDEIYEYATELTKQGLGFPQYCNDDVVVPGLVKLGYEYDDAIDYTVAACWEFIVPNCAADWPNAKTMDFPHIVSYVIKTKLMECDTFDSLMDSVEKGISDECDRLIDSAKSAALAETPLLAVFTDGCIESLTDLWHGGAKYRNFGCHGAGISNATDALAAVNKHIYKEKTISKENLLSALDSNFEGFSEIRNLLINSPKMGNNDDFADDIACRLMKIFGDKMNGRDNGHGGIWRAGTGSAMEYIWKGEACPATADGRRSGEPYSSSFSPSLDVKTTGLLSVIQSFTKYDMSDIINGGPLTIEIHDTVLRNDIGIKKVAALVKNYILLGGHQLQINSVNRERLLDAQKHPENYPNLIVRVWGWSGYFNELDVKFQNHIIRRCEFTS